MSHEDGAGRGRRGAGRTVRVAVGIDELHVAFDACAQITERLKRILYILLILVRCNTVDTYLMLAKNEQIGGDRKFPVHLYTCIVRSDNRQHRAETKQRSTY